MSLGSSALTVFGWQFHQLLYGKCNTNVYVLFFWKKFLARWAAARQPLIEQDTLFSSNHHMPPGSTYYTCVYTFAWFSGTSGRRWWCRGVGVTRRYNCTHFALHFCNLKNSSNRIIIASIFKNARVLRNPSLLLLSQLNISTLVWTSLAPDSSIIQLKPPKSPMQFTTEWNVMKSQQKIP